MKAALAAALLAFAPAVALAQNATPVQETMTDPRAVVLYATATGTAQQTVTITPPAGFYAYIVAIEVSSCASAAPAASLLTTTTTNLGGAKWYGGITATAGACDKVTFYPAKPVKSVLGPSSATIVSNAAITSVNYSVSAWFYYAKDGT